MSGTSLAVKNSRSDDVVGDCSVRYIRVNAGVQRGLRYEELNLIRIIFSTSTQQQRLPVLSTHVPRSVAIRPTSLVRSIDSSRTSEESLALVPVMKHVHFVGLSSVRLQAQLVKNLSDPRFVPLALRPPMYHFPPLKASTKPSLDDVLLPRRRKWEDFQTAVVVDGGD